MTEKESKNKHDEISNFNNDEELERKEENWRKKLKLCKNVVEKLEKEGKEIEKQKLLKRQLKEQNNSPAKLRKMADTEHQKGEENAEAMIVKQGQSKRTSTEEKQTTYLEIPYKKRQGVISTHGIMFEVKMAALIFLKLINLGYSFFLCTNLDGAGDFDDIVVKYTTEDNTTETLFIQLKHAKDDNKTRTLSFVPERSEKLFFDLHKYFTSVCDSQLSKDFQHVIFSSDPSNVWYLIFTNADVNKSILGKVNENEVNCFVRGISVQGDILKICEYVEYEEFCSLIEQVNKHGGEQYDEQNTIIKNKKLKKIIKLSSNKSVSNTSKEKDECKNISVRKFKTFISNTRVLCKQPNVNDLDMLIKDEIAKVTISNNETKQVFTRLIDKMTKWWENESYYLTEKSKMWNCILREASWFREKEREFVNCGVRFKPEVVVEMRNTILQKKGVINIVCHDDITTVTTLKVWQALNLNEQQNYILVSIKEYLENEQSIFRTWPNCWCKSLVIDGKEDCELSEQVIVRLKYEPEAQLIIISSEKCNFQHCDLPFTRIIDNSTLDQLDDESQEKLITKTINFQGHIVPLSSILEREHFENLSSNALSHLITDDKFILGENFDSFKTQGYVKRHIEIPYVSKAILDNNDKYTILAIELKHEQSFLRGSLDIRMSTRDRLNTENPENVKKHSMLNKTKCNYVILTKGKEEEEYKMLCDKFLNVHWIKECNETNTQFVETRRLYSDNRNPDKKLLLWKKSRGNIETVRKHLVSSDMYNIDEERFITSGIESPVIITGDPGIGKTSLLKQMAVSLKNHFPTKWVVFIDLPQYCEFLDNKEVMKEHHIIDIIKTSLNLNNTCSEYMIRAVKNPKNFIILLDAFDEISPDYSKKVKEILTFFVKSSFSVYITSRMSNVRELESHISAISYTVMNFNEDEATIFLTNILQQKNKVFRKNVNMFSTEVIAKPWSGQESFTTNPLHILMLAEIYNDKVKSENIKILNVLQIYTEFMKKKCEEFYRKTRTHISHPNIKSELQTLIQRFFSFNKVMGIKQILSEELLKNLNGHSITLEESDNAIYFKIMKIGVAETVSNNNIKYLHRSYAEYFSALWLAENCRKNITLLKEIIHTKEMKLVRKFYDLKCAENCPLHTAVITFCEPETLNTLIQNRENLTCVDIMERSALHLAAAYNNVQAVEILINHIRDFNFWDIMFYTPTEYAIINCNWESVDVLFSNQLVSLTKAQLALKLKHMKKEIIFICCAKGLKFLLATFIKNIHFNHKIHIPNLKSLKISTPPTLKLRNYYSLQASRESFPLFVAVHYNQYELVTFLIENKCDPWVRDSNGNTVLHIASSYGYTKLVRYFIELGTCNKDNTREIKDVDCVLNLTNISNENVLKNNTINKQFENMSFLFSTVCTNNNIRSKCIHEIDYKNIKDMTPLLLAAQNGHADTFVCFTEYGFDINYNTLSGNNALIFASEKGHIDIVKFSVKKGCNVNHANEDGKTAILCAAGEGYFDIVKFFVENGCNINHADNDGNTALFYAASGGYLDIVKFFVQNGCNLNHANNNGYTALLVSAENGNTDVVKFCIENGCNINHADNDGNTALFCAARARYLDIVKFCVQNGCNINHADNDGNTALLSAASKGYHDLVKFCVENGCNLNHANNNGCTALLNAAREGYLDIVKFCVENGCNINHADNVGNTALLYAANDGYLDIVKFCVENGCNIDHADNDGDTAIFTAAGEGYLDIVKFCVENGCNLNFANNDGKTALLYAAGGGNLDIVKFCVENGCNLTHSDNNGNTALMLSAENGHRDIVKFCIENGCKINHADNDVDTALLYAAIEGNLDIFRFFVETGCNLNHAYNNGNTAFLLSAQYGKYDLVKFCIENGCYINYADNYGNTALIYAAREGYLDILKICIENGGNINHVTKNGKTAILYATDKRYLDILKFCVKKGGNINHADNNGVTALISASRNGYLDIVKFCVENGCNIDHADNDGDTAIFTAAGEGNLDIVKFCVENGCNLTHSDNNGNTAFLLSAQYGKYDLVKFCIENGCYINYADNNGNTALIYAACKGYLDILKICVENGGNINHVNKYGKTAILYATDKRYLDILKFCVKKGCNINHADNDGVTALISASRNGYLDIVKFCVENGCNINHADNVGYTALLYAANEGYLDIVKFCVENGCNIDHADNNGGTAIFTAAGEGYLDIVKFCVENGCNLNFANNDGKTLLLYAAGGGYLDIVQFCVENGCNINHADNDRKTALLYAAGGEYLDIVKFCVENGCNIDHADNNGETAIIIAAGEGYLDIVKFCVENGCNLNFANNDGKTALLFAAGGGYLDIVKFCVENGCNINHANSDGKTAFMQPVEDILILPSFV